MPAVEYADTEVSQLTLDVRELETELVITERDDSVPGVALLTLVDAHGRPLPQWAPGAHIDLLLADGLVRQYSLCGDPRDRSHWKLGILRSPTSRGGSEFVHQNLNAGTHIVARGPRNHFPLADAERYILIAGGIGITPIKAMLTQIQASGKDWHLYYGGRSRDTMAFGAELTNSDHVTIWPQDEKGHLDLAKILAAPEEGTLIYCCGPEPLMASVETHSRAWGAGTLHTERFTAKPLAEPAQADSFEVELRNSGITITVPPDKTVLEAVEEAGVEVLYSCREGTCGTCETEVLEGQPDHRDSILNDDDKAANDCMMICVSRCIGKRLVLGL